MFMYGKLLPWLPSENIPSRKLTEAAKAAVEKIACRIQAKLNVSHVGQQTVDFPASRCFGNADNIGLARTLSLCLHRKQEHIRRNACDACERRPGEDFCKLTLVNAEKSLVG